MRLNQAMEIYQQWLQKADEETKRELAAIAGDEAEIEERFYQPLIFGTGGLRGVIGAGTNRINGYTVRQATQALASYIIGHGQWEKGVCISYDSRYHSDEFAFSAACVLAANGIRAYLSDTLRPVPFLSYSVLQKHAAAGIMITASHNPPKYNGYKVYCDTGEQISPAMADEVCRYIAQTDLFDGVKTMDADEAKRQGLIVMMGDDVEDSYLDNVLAQRLHPQVAEQTDLKIVYTPLHGSGNKPVRRALSRAGYNDVFAVPEQELPDPAFSTVKSPNPEEKEGFALAIRLAEEKGADIIIGTDPDCDRVGILVRDGDGYQPMTGNQIGVILMEYILSSKKLNGTLPDNGAVIKTIVTTRLANLIGKAYGITVMDVLTGFKFIGEKIRQFELDGSYTYLFGFEESYGFLAGTYTRDKDAVVASLLISEAAAYYRLQNKALLDVLEELYDRYGAYCERLRSVTLEGLEGLQKITDTIAALRENPPKEIGGVAVTAVSDYQKSLRVTDGGTEQIDLPKSNVLLFELEDGSTFVVRPSGTEPKIKIYFMVIGKNQKQAEQKMDVFEQQVLDRIMQ